MSHHQCSYTKSLIVLDFLELQQSVSSPICHSRFWNFRGIFGIFLFSYILKFFHWNKPLIVLDIQELQQSVSSPFCPFLKVLFAVLLEADSHANFLHSLAKVKEDWEVKLFLLFVAYVLVIDLTSMATSLEFIALPLFSSPKSSGKNWTWENRWRVENFC